jgi:RimJ/RimL family protein N-acetyltransferase
MRVFSTYLQSGSAYRSYSPTRGKAPAEHAECGGAPAIQPSTVASAASKPRVDDLAAGARPHPARRVAPASSRGAHNQRPFGYYQIIRAADGLAVGGAGFKGPPDDRSIEIGYGLAPSARGHGYASEAVTTLLILAAENGVDTVLADTSDDNVASRQTLLSAGFMLVATHVGLPRYRASAPGPLHTEELPM